MFESLFEFLFKYRLFLFQEGDFSFTSPWPWAVGCAPSGWARVGGSATEPACSPWAA